MPDKTGPEIGKLIITCPAVKQATWVYYLQGVRDGK
jgi:hypothetical protein